MTPEEAKLVATIVATADNYCTYCITDLCKQLKAQFPEFDWATLAGLNDPLTDVSVTDIINAALRKIGATDNG